MFASLLGKLLKARQEIRRVKNDFNLLISHPPSPAHAWLLHREAGELLMQIKLSFEELLQLITQ